MIKNFQTYKTKNINWEEIKQLINQGKSNKDILNQTGIPYWTLRKYLPQFYIKKLSRNNKIKQGLSNRTKDGQVALYEKLRKEINQGKHKCEICKSKRNIEIHHKERLHYDKEWRYWKADNFNNEKKNIRFLCNSCHQKLHWKEDKRVMKVPQDSITGRFIKKEVIIV